MDRQVAISLVAELRDTTTPFFNYFMTNLLVEYEGHPRINVLHRIISMYDQRDNHLDVTLASDAVYQMRDDDEILRKFMNFFHFQYMDTRRMLSETQDMLAITQGMLSTTREMLTDLNVILARIV